jgi:hypothetical protein
MRRTGRLYVTRMMVILFTIHYSLSTASAQTSEVEQLTAQMYKIYNSHDTEQFLDVTERLKQACLKTGEERTFYGDPNYEAMRNL